MAHVSVVIPTYNRTQFLEEAILSVLQQTHPVSEIIIVNDGSDDGYTHEFDRLLSLDSVIRLIVNKTNQGVSFSRNQGVLAASGDYIIFLDDDDKLDRHFVRQASLAFESEVEIDAVVSRTEVMSSSENNFNKRLTENLFKDRKRRYGEFSVNTKSYFLIHCPMIHSFMFRREVLLRHPFDEDLAYGEDMLLWIEMCDAGVQFRLLNMISSYVRLHPDSMTNRCGFEEKYKFYVKLETSGWVANGLERDLHAIRTFYFKLANLKVPSLKLFGHAINNLSALAKFTWLNFVVRLRSWI